jgi:fatty acid desaturase
MWYIHGKQYDLNNFKHPGGPIALDIAKNRDATELFQSYHPFSPHIQKILSKYEVKPPVLTEETTIVKQQDGKPMFDWENESEFVKDLKSQVRPIIQQYGKYADGTRWFQLIVLTLVTLALFKPFIDGYWWSLFVFPLAVWLITVNAFHDASHLSISKDWRINTLVMYLFPWFSSPTTWFHQHIIGHHVYTNLDQDPDLHHGELLWRFNPQTKFRPWFRFQVYYLIAIWGIVAVSLAFVFDFTFMFRKSYHNVVKSMELSDRRRKLHYFGRFVTFIMIYVWPFFMSSYSWPKAIAWAIVPHSIFAICFSFSSQLNHLIDDSISKFSSDWYAHQAMTSHSYAPQSLFWFIATGGLNLQIEHHLFPGVNGWKLRRIQPIVQQCCEKHGIPYNLSATGSIAFQKHVQHLMNMAIDPKKAD